MAARAQTLNLKLRVDVMKQLDSLLSGGGVLMVPNILSRFFCDGIIFDQSE